MSSLTAANRNDGGSIGGGGGVPDFSLIMKFLLGINRPYVTEEGAQKLKQYKYQGGDTGFVYRYLYNPLALKIVEKFTPEYLA